MRATHQPPFGPLKTKSSYREVPLPAQVQEALTEHLELRPPEPGGLVFTKNTAGAAIPRSTFNKVWRIARATVGLPPSMGFHALRHYYASVLVAGGASVKLVQSLMGHATSATTLEIYSHLWPDDDAKTRNTIEQEWNGTGLVELALNRVNASPGELLPAP